MKNLIFDIYNLSHKDRSIAAAKRAFLKAGAEVTSVDVDPKTKRTSGVEYREIQFGFADSQSIRFAVNATGDVAQVKLNGSLTPLKNQDDHAAVIKELVALMERARPKIQAKLAKIKMALPPSIRTAAPRMEVMLRDRVESLDRDIATATAKRDELKAKVI
ncbi:hypothetical protein [Burkholderia gladioli]|uniref:defense against restriction DarA-related protein n=1 Tax=Burkholderia gladioli TaxID=28095 RepID=UPI00163F2613|nr:hypothetical protein [Burkholderia gladioli]